MSPPPPSPLTIPRQTRTSNLLGEKRVGRVCSPCDRYDEHDLVEDVGFGALGDVRKNRRGRVHPRRPHPVAAGVKEDELQLGFRPHPFPAPLQPFRTTIRPSSINERLGKKSAITPGNATKKL